MAFVPMLLGREEGPGWVLPAAALLWTTPQLPGICMHFQMLWGRPLAEACVPVQLFSGGVPLAWASMPKPLGLGQSPGWDLPAAVPFWSTPLLPALRITYKQLQAFTDDMQQDSYIPWS